MLHIQQNDVFENVPILKMNRLRYSRHTSEYTSLIVCYLLFASLVHQSLYNNDISIVIYNMGS